MSKQLIALVITSQFITNAAATEQNTLFQELDKAMLQWQGNDDKQQDKDEFEQYKQQHFKEYEDYVAQHFAEFDAYRDQLIMQWGEATMSDNVKYVSYSEANDTRLEVDFENNTLKVAIKHSSSDTPSQEQAKQVFDAFLKSNSALLDAFFKEQDVGEQREELIKQSVHNVDLSRKVQALVDAKRQIKQQTLQQQHLIERQLDESLSQESSSDDVVTANQQLAHKNAELKQLETERLKKLKSSIKKLAGQSQNGQKVSEFVINLPKNTLRPARAQVYKTDVAKQSQRFDIEPSLIFSVMHTESHFNPLAKSAIPAFGLMQIVPTSAGVDVNRFLFKVDEPMSSPYLYVAENNIEAGAAYLHILDKRYLRHINDPLSRKYCMIAAYNTGAGNVARVFNSDGSRNIKKASRIINSLTPERVREALEAGLPYDETKHYLKRVLERESLYQEI